MTADEVNQWIDRLLDEEPSGDEEVADLEAVLKQQPEALQQLAERALLQSLLRQVAVHPLVDRMETDAATEANGLSAEVLQTVHTVSSPSAIPEPTARVRTWRVPARWLSWLAPVVLGLAFLGGWFWSRQSDAVASAAHVVERALESFRVTRDRKYAVVVDLEPAVRRRGGRLPAADGSTLWVRNREFVQLYGGPSETLAWGRDERGAVWFSLGGQTAAVFESDEVPEPLHELCELRSLELETLLKSLLRDYELQFAGDIPGGVQIRALPRAGREPARHGLVELEIDRGLRQVRRVTLERLHRDRPIARVTFALQEESVQSGTLYDCQSHLARGARVLGRGARRGSRSELLREFLNRIRQPGTERSEN